MSKKKKGRTDLASKARSKRKPVASASANATYDEALLLAEQGDSEKARKLYDALDRPGTGVRLRALVLNDLAALRAQDGEIAEAIKGLQGALSLDADCRPARQNLELLQHEGAVPVETVEAESVRHVVTSAEESHAVRVAIVSFLFNWPSTGGGNVHTFELAKFLSRAGYRAGYHVRHLFVRFPAWGIGEVREDLPYPAEALEFAETEWDLDHVQARIRRAVDSFGPDHVIVTDSWNIKPLLAEAVSRWPYILRLQAMECLCPLNNLRLLPLSPIPWGEGRVRGYHRAQPSPPAGEGRVRGN